VLVGSGVGEGPAVGGTVAVGANVTVWDAVAGKLRGG